jgi:hypothetical protein
MDQGGGAAAHQTTLELAAAPLLSNVQVTREHHDSSLLSKQSKDPWVMSKLTLNGQVAAPSSGQSHFSTVAPSELSAGKHSK